MRQLIDSALPGLQGVWAIEKAFQEVYLGFKKGRGRFRDIELRCRACFSGAGIPAGRPDVTS